MDPLFPVAASDQAKLTFHMSKETLHERIVSAITCHGFVAMLDMLPNDRQAPYSNADRKQENPC